MLPGGQREDRHEQAWRGRSDPGKRPPLGITVSPPRWRLGYELAGNVDALAPLGIFGRVDDEAEFERLYRARLKRISVAEIRRQLEAIAAAHAARGVVLLCFEDVEAGESCHRTIFATWWRDQTGEMVEELRAPERSAASGFPTPR